MNELFTNQKEQIHKDGLNQTLKTTSLQYLEEALSREAYEQCAEILKEARGLDIDQKEIEKLIGQHVAFLKARDRKVVPFKARRPL